MYFQYDLQIREKARYKSPVVVDVFASPIVNVKNDEFVDIEYWKNGKLVDTTRRMSISDYEALKHEQGVLS